MGWYVLRCKTGQEERIIHSCRTHLTADVLEEAFIFRSERLWRTEGRWIPLMRDMFPGYVFLQSSCPELLHCELDQFRKILRIMEEPGYLISVYQEEEKFLRELCGVRHVLELSYGYNDIEEGKPRIVNGPLNGLESKILKINWHKRIAILGMQVARKEKIVWAGVDLLSEKTGNKLSRNHELVS